MAQFTLQINGTTPPEYIETVTRDSLGAITSYTQTPYLTASITGTENEMISLDAELSSLVGTTPIRK